MALVFRVVVAHKLLFALCQFYPVAVFHHGGVACSCLLLLHFFIKLFLVNGQSVLAANQFCQVKRETIGVEEFESLHAVQFGLASLFHLFHGLCQQVDAVGQGTQESIFFLFHHFHDEFTLGWKFGICTTHLVDQRGHQSVEECLFLSQEGVGIAHGAAQDAPDDIARFGVAGKLSVGDGECHGTQVVRHHAHGHIDLLVLAILQAREA